MAYVFFVLFYDFWAGLLPDVFPDTIFRKALAVVPIKVSAPHTVFQILFQACPRHNHFCRFRRVSHSGVNSHPRHLPLLPAHICTSHSQRLPPCIFLRPFLPACPGTEPAPPLSPPSLKSSFSGRKKRTKPAPQRMSKCYRFRYPDQELI